MQIGRKTKPEPEVELTPAQLALIDQRVQERLNAIREAEAAKRPAPKPEPLPEQMPRRYGRTTPELDAAILAAFDAETPDRFPEVQASKATWFIYNKVPRDERLFQLLESWRTCTYENLDWLEQASERALVAAYMIAQHQRRVNPNEFATGLAEKITTLEAFAENARYWDRATQALEEKAQRDGVA